MANGLDVPLRFYFYDERLNRLSTVEENHLEDNDIIEVVGVQSGSIGIFGQYLYPPGIQCLIIQSELDNKSLCQSVVSKLNGRYESLFDLHPHLLSAELCDTLTKYCYKHYDLRSRDFKLELKTCELDDIIGFKSLRQLEILMNNKYDKIVIRVLVQYTESGRYLLHRVWYICTFLDCVI